MFFYFFSFFFFHRRTINIAAAYTILGGKYTTRERDAMRQETASTTRLGMIVGIENKTLFLLSYFHIISYTWSDDVIATSATTYSVEKHVKKIK